MGAVGGMRMEVQTMKNGCSGTSGWWRDGGAGRLMGVRAETRARGRQRASPWPGGCGQVGSWSPKGSRCTVAAQFLGQTPGPACFKLSGPWTPLPGTDLPQENVQIAHLGVLHAIKFESTRTHTTLQMHARIPRPVPRFLATERWLLSGHPTSCAILPTHIPPQGQHLA